MATKEQPKTVVIANTIAPQAPIAGRDMHALEARVLVRVKMREGRVSTVAAGLCIRASDVHDDGYIYLPPIPASFVESLQKRCDEDRVGVKDAVEMYARDLRRYIEDRGGEVAKKDTEKGRARREELERMFPGSVEERYFDRRGKGIQPFVAVEVIEEGLPPPESESEKSMRIFAQRLLPHVNGTGEADARVLALENENRSLRAELSKNTSELVEIKAMLQTLTAPAPAAGEKAKPKG